MPKYTFHTTHFTLIREHTYITTSFEVEAATPEEAYELISPKFPEGSRLFCWHSDEPVEDECEES